MNPRIKELAKQAQEEADNLWSRLTPQEYKDTYTQKFAELIVRQCGYYADIFESAGCPVDMDTTETKPSDYIKKHFGVEE
jgi:hypothetical protein